MKKIYFNVVNGEVVEPFTSLPTYCAIVQKGLVTEIHACFSVQNIIKGGQGWVKEQVQNQAEIWKEHNPDLKKSLNRFVRQPKYWFKDTNHIESSYDRFIFIRFY